MRKGLQTLRVSFDEPRLTHFGGLVLIQRFCQRLHLRRRLQRSLALPQRRGDYLPADLILALLFAVIAGLRRLNKTDVLQYNGAFLSLLGLSQFPDQSTLRRFLKRLSSTTIRRCVRLHDQLRREAETQSLGYVIVAREYRGIKQRAQAARFQKLRHGWEVAEFHYTPTHWKKPHRFVVVRCPQPADPVEAKQLTLFRARRYAYHVLVINLELTPWRVWRFYCPRATIQKDIRELLYDLPLGKIPTDDWLANVAFFQLVLFAYDLAHWFKRLCLPPAYLHATLETLRTDLLVVPARLVRRGGRNVLHLPRDYHHRALFEAALRKVSQLRLGRKT